MKLFTSPIALIFLWMPLLLGVLVEGHLGCGTPDPSEAKVIEMKNALAKPYVVTKRNVVDETGAEVAPLSAQECIQCHEVQVIVHLVDTEDADSMSIEITPAVLQNELKILNDAFAASAFKFVLKETNSILNDTLALGYPYPDTLEGAVIGAALGEYRKGEADILNIFYSVGTCDGGLEGFSSSPDGYLMYPVGEYQSTHYVGMCSDEITTEESLAAEGSFETTLIHQVGHWMGLLHTFAGLDCDGDGDLVDDTPAQGSNYTGDFPESLLNCGAQDTCPFNPGDDPIDNFMNYSPDKCQDKFTPGQMERTYIQFDEHYRKLNTCGSTPTIEAEFLFDENPEQNAVYFWEWGEASDTGDFYLLKDLDMDHDYALKQAQFKNCFTPKSLYLFTVSDEDSDGIQDPGFFKLSANGRELFTESTFDNKEFYAFFSLDASECRSGHKRFGLDLTFDEFSEETTWTLASADTGEVVCDYTTSLPIDRDTYAYPEFHESTLYVDCCVPTDTLYIFTINDSTGDGIFFPGGYRLLVDGQVIHSGGGDFGMSRSQSVGVGNLPETQAPSVSSVPSLSVSPSAAPTVSSMPSSAPSKEEKQQPVFCFSGSSLVTVKGKGTVPMHQLQIGDLVHTGKDVFEPVYSFGHRNEGQRASFLKIVTTAQTVLEISADHMIFVKGRGFAPASMLHKGDTLVNSQGNGVTVKDIQSITSTGVYAPFTPSGRIVVNDVVASSFVAFNHKMTLFSFFSFQWIAHSFEFPHRVACHYMGSCPDESYTSEGVSTWVNAPLQAGLWVMEQNDGGVLFKTFCLIAFMMVCLLFNVLEVVMFNPWCAISLACLRGIVVSASRNKKNAA